MSALHVICTTTIDNRESLFIARFVFHFSFLPLIFLYSCGNKFDWCFIYTHVSLCS